MVGGGDRDSRFALDPREQIAAQRWARLRGLEVLGVCHSHPKPHQNRRFGIVIGRNPTG